MLVVCVVSCLRGREHIVPSIVVHSLRHLVFSGYKFNARAKMSGVRITIKRTAVQSTS